MVPFASLLVSLRELNGLSRRQVARHLGISHSQVGRLESGAALPDTQQVRQLADLVGLRADVMARASLGAPLS